MIHYLTARLYFIIILMPLLFSACGEKKNHTDNHEREHETTQSEKEEHDSHDHHGAESSGATFQEGKGILLSDETRQALGLELIEVIEQNLQPSITLKAQVYRAASEPSRHYSLERKGFAYATALVETNFAASLQPNQKLFFSETETHLEGTIWRLDSTQLSALGKIEALLELPDPNTKWQVGDFVEVKILLNNQAQKALVLPSSAILQTANSTFAYVLNGKHLLRTEIKTGSENEGNVEITEGLYEGDSVAVKPVEALYLIELRATKGGGHSH